MRNLFKRSPQTNQTNQTATQTEATFPAAPYGHHFEYAYSNGGGVFVQLVSNRTGYTTYANTLYHNGKTLEARLAAAMQSLIDDHNKRATQRHLVEAVIKKAKAAQ